MSTIDANVVPAEHVDSQVKPTAMYGVSAASADLRKSVANLRQRLTLLARLRRNSGHQQQQHGKAGGPSLDVDDGRGVQVPELSQNYGEQFKELLQCANDNVSTMRLSTELYSGRLVQCILVAWYKQGTYIVYKSFPFWHKIDYHTSDWAKFFKTAHVNVIQDCVTYFNFKFA